MLSRIERRWRAFRSSMSRSRWLTRLLGLEVAETGWQQSGLVMIQVDGLSHVEIQKALARKKMPFVRRLIEREYYELRRMYAGVPSTTSVVQAELFYGISQAVPGFSFLDRECDELVTMIEPEAAARVERELAERTDGALLDGGSGYANNYTGGAEEPHFCPTAKGWGVGLRDARPIAILALVVTNFFSVLRMVALACLETVIAVFDLVRGVIGGKSFFQELKFVPTRLAITVLLRELAVIGANIDINRGLPIVHLNLLGYDEQAHRRGPKSRFAHWTLGGIDDAIKRVWKATRLSRRRQYELWVYSDHGQEPVTPYSSEYKGSFGKAVASVFSEYTGKEQSYRAGSQWGAQLNRAGNLGMRLANRFVPDRNGEEEAEEDVPKLSVAALGPIAMIYWRAALKDQDKRVLASGLVEDAKAPMVLYRNEAGHVQCHTKGGQADFEADGASIIGSDHPFAAEVAQDLVRLCGHKNAGDFMAVGTAGPCGPSLTFANENGAHGGAGSSETVAFALAPRDTARLPSKKKCMRISDLRAAALHIRGRAAGHADDLGETRRSPTRTLRLLTYNVHSCIGMDGQLSPQRIARVIARCQPDVVCLQELDVNRPRTAEMDQAHRIAEILGMDFHFYPALQIEEERYGDAILTSMPMKVVKSGGLSNRSTRTAHEPRGAIWVEISWGETPVQIVNTHLGLWARDRGIQVRALLGEDWLGHPDCRDPLILCGDFNALPRSIAYWKLSRHLRDAQRALPGHRPKATFPGRFPSARIDHVFVGSGLEVLSIEVPKNDLSRLASDHLPLITELRLLKSGP